MKSPGSSSLDNQDLRCKVAETTCFHYGARHMFSCSAKSRILHVLVRHVYCWERYIHTDCLDSEINKRRNSDCNCHQISMANFTEFFYKVACHDNISLLALSSLPNLTFGTHQTHGSKAGLLRLAQQQSHFSQPNHCLSSSGIAHL